MSAQAGGSTSLSYGALQSDARYNSSADGLQASRIDLASGINLLV